MTKDKFIEHGFSKGEAVLYKGQPAEVVSIHINAHGWKHLVVAFGGSGRPGQHHNYAACGPEDIELTEEKKMLYSVLEQHADGSWWYHPGYTRRTRAEAQQKADSSFWWDPERPRRIFEHEAPFPQNHAIYTTDFENFGFAGLITWTRSNGSIR
ncbi:MAG: hypothetical protein IJL31_00240 [Oscillospiraceae bacterium]|nr:hypothetical protein [Bacillota bacterium]MBQ6029875.1 hypothetical protein [Oscillospiraceae bacterium]MBQ6029916.1 hypothetical protein [Oscillospiraceae bacterium]MBQ6243215.1 hypothetical protein [Bacteroidales bacterium]